MANQPSQEGAGVIWINTLTHINLTMFWERKVAAKTMKVWLLNYRRIGFKALKPKRRGDRGGSRRLSPEDKDHILEEQKKFSTCLSASSTSNWSRVEKSKNWFTLLIAAVIVTFVFACCRSFILLSIDGDCGDASGGLASIYHVWIWLKAKKLMN